MKVCVKVPQDKNGKRKYTIGGKSGRWYKEAYTMFNALEDKFLMVRSKEKTRFVVDYGSGVLNETIESGSRLQQMWCLSVFLEDYLPVATVRRLGDDYLKVSK